MLQCKIPSVKYIENPAPPLVMLIIIRATMAAIPMFFMMPVFLVVAVAAFLTDRYRLWGWLQPRRRRGARGEKGRRSRQLGFAERLEQFLQLAAVEPYASALWADVEFDA